MSKPDSVHEPTGLATPKAVAEFLGKDETFLTKLRYEKRGPSFVRLGGGPGRRGTIRYKWSDVLAWVEQGTITTSETA